MNGYERRAAVWNTLCHRRHVTSAYLASEYHVSRRTIYDDVVKLSLIYPIVTVQGRYGGIKVAEWYKPSCYAYSPAQMKLLLRLSSTLEGDDAIIMSSIVGKFQD